MGLEGVSSIRNMQAAVQVQQAPSVQPAVQPQVKAVESVETPAMQPQARAVENTEVAPAQSQETVKDNGRQAENAGKSAANVNVEKEPTANEKASNEQLKRAIEQLNRKIGNSEAIFGVHEDTHRVTIKIIDKDTKEVLKELPPEKTLDMIARVWEMAGILVDEKR